MNRSRDPEAIVAAWLEDGPIDLPDETRRAISVAVRTQPRARRTFLGGIAMTSLSRFATAAGIVLAVGAVSVLLLSNRATGPGAATRSSPSSPPPIAASSGPSGPAASASPSPAPSASWIPFSSIRYRYDAKYPAGFTAAQSTRAWILGAEQRDSLAPASDVFRGTVWLTAFSLELPAGTSRDAWIASYYGPESEPSPDPCSHTAIELETKEVDGHPVVFTTENDTASCGGTAAFVVVGTRLYVFSHWLSGADATLEAFLSTVRFRP